MTDKTIVTTNEPSPRRPVDVLFQARLTVTPPNKGGRRRRPRRFVEPMKRVGERIGEKVLWELSKHAWEKAVDFLSELFRRRAAPLTVSARRDAPKGLPQDYRCRARGS